MVTKNIDIKTQDGICDAFVAFPSESGTYPGVILYMDAFGLRPYLNSMVEKLAAHGYYVLAPNVLYRVKRSPLLDVTYPLKAEDMAGIRDTIIPLARALQPEQAMSDAKFYFEFLSQQPQVKSNHQFGTTGYCMGGSLSLRTAARYPEQIAAAACFHAGHLATDAPDSPHRWLASAQAELYIANADNDPSLPPEQIERLRNELTRLGKKFEMETYPSAAHGFTMADLPVYNAEALSKHWQKLFALFDRNLK